MSMQEPQQYQQAGRWPEQSDDSYQVGYPGSGGYDADQRQRAAANAYQDQEQKIYPQESADTFRRGLKIICILAIVFSSIGFLFATLGIVASTVVLGFADGSSALLGAGALGLFCAVVTLLLLVAIFIAAIVVLAINSRRSKHKRKRYTHLQRPA